MSKPLNAAVVRVGNVPNTYDIERVTADPRVLGLNRKLGSRASIIPATSVRPGASTLIKYADWDQGWRPDGEGPLYPAEAPLYTAYTQLVPGAFYLNDAMLGDVYDAGGDAAKTLVANVAPTFQQTLEGKVGIWTPAVTGGKQSANINDPGANSFIWGGVAAMISFGGFVINTCLFGRSEAGAAKGFAFYVPSATGILNYALKDSAGNAITAALGTNMIATPIRPFLVLGQVDRAAGLFRALVARPGAVINTTSVAAPPATFTFAGQEFGQGAIPGYSAGQWNGYTIYADGVQCEGADRLHDLAIGLGWIT